MERSLHTIPSFSPLQGFLLLLRVQQQQALPPPHSFPLHMQSEQCFLAIFFPDNHNRCQKLGPPVKQYFPLQELVRVE